MNATKKFAISLIFLIAASILSITGLANNKKPSGDINPPGADLVLYGKINCPYCDNVKRYLDENNISEKLAIAQKEVSQNETNKNEFVAKAQICGLDQTKLVVPMLWDAKNSKCYTGDKAIIDFVGRQTGK